jgi:hypothetical protein
MEGREQRRDALTIYVPLVQPGQGGVPDAVADQAREERFAWSAARACCPPVPMAGGPNFAPTLTCFAQRLGLDPDRLLREAERMARDGELP